VENLLDLKNQDGNSIKNGKLDQGSALKLNFQGQNLNLFEKKL
jgi:hypothetical protein